MFLSCDFSIFNANPIHEKGIINLNRILQHTLVFIILATLCGCSQNKEQRVKNAEAAYSKAEAFYNAGHYRDAINALENAVSSYRDLENDSAVGECYSVAAYCWQQLGWYDSAMENYHRSLRTFEPTGNKKLERKGKINLARFQQYVGDAAAAIQTSLDVSIMGRIFTDSLDVFTALDIASGAYRALGEYEQECYTINQMIGIDSVLFQGGNYFRLMNKKILACEELGQHDQACIDYSILRERAKVSSNDTSLARIDYTWGLIQERAGHSDSALRALSSAVSSMDRHTDPMLRINILASLGSLAYRSRHFDNARMYYSDALDVVKKTDVPAYERLLQILLLACDWKASGERSSVFAPEFIKRCSAIRSDCEQNDFIPGEAILLFLQARIKENAGDTAGVRTLYMHALNLAIQQRVFLSSGAEENEWINALLSDDNLQWSDPLLKYYCAAGDIRAAFVLFEGEKQRAVQNYFSRLHIKTRNDRLNRGITEYQRQVNMSRRLQQDISDERSAGKNKNQERLQSLLERIPCDSLRVADAADNIAKENANYYWLLSGMPPALTQIQDSLRPGTALVEYIPLQDCIYILVVEHDTVYLRKSECSRTHLRGLVQEYLKTVADPRLSDENIKSTDYASISQLDRLSELLGQILLQPIVSLSNNIHAIEIIPSPEMNWLPVHTLKVNGKAMIEQIAISYLPSTAAVLFTQNEDSQVFHVGAVGHPGHTGWDVEYELRDIRSFYDSARVFVGNRATLETFKVAAYDALHLALEFNLNTDVPDRSTFVLSDGRTSYGLTSASVGDALQIPSPFVMIISNLSTQAGGMSEYVPLAFLANAVPSVITTMWQGNRREKRYFGEVFYTALKGGLIPSQAYQDAILATKKKTEFSTLNKWGLYYRFGK